MIVYDHSLLTSVMVNAHGAQFGDRRTPYFIEFTTSTKKPTVGLLRVNKQIREEASPIFYGKNLFNLSCDPENPTTLMAWGKHVAHFRYVMVSFSSSRISNECGNRLLPYSVSDNRPIDEDIKLVLEHNALVDDLLCRWEEKLCLTQNMRLKTLLINMVDCRCPQYCCRLPKKICTRFLKDYLLLNEFQAKPREQSTAFAGPKVKYIGIVTDEEIFMRNMGFLDKNSVRKGARTKSAPIGIFPNG